jgi:altronate hydrolase
MPEDPRFLRLNIDDNVAVALDTMPRGHQVDGGPKLIEDIPAGHKFALYALPAGVKVIKFGQNIGETSQPVAAGEHVHVHNLAFASADERRGYSVRPMPACPNDLPLSFDGYRRPDGRSATRNYIGVMSSANCSATVVSAVAQKMRDALRDPAYASSSQAIDGVVALTHSLGCGIVSKGEAFDTFRRTLDGFANHPNFAAILVIGLGCEVFQARNLASRARDEFGKEVPFLNIQDTGGTLSTVEAGVRILLDHLPRAAEARREAIPVSELVLAMQCGGSDGYSGLTANPALGVASDLLVAMGGTTILSETPEIYGAEHLLLARAVDDEVRRRLEARIDWWRRYTEQRGAVLDANPSPGNKAGGLTTILEKSLGAVAKGGQAPLNDVIEYAEPLRRNGFVFMDSPGYDPCSATGQVASGANLLAFTTGRGSAFGFKPVPSLKLATNTPLFQKMRGDMDINCGDVLDGTSLERKGVEIYRTLIRVASGEQTLSERLGYGDHEFVPWNIGPVM